jgi:flagellar hook-associated protein 3 FlgL
MRISTSQIYDQGVTGMNNQLTALNKTQQQVSSGLSILTPSDNPAASASVIQVGQLESINTQYQSNRTSANNALGAEDSVLQQVSNLIVSAQSLATSAGNATLSNSDRANIATQLQAQLQEMVGLANSKDGEGNYLFAGNQSTTQPFSQNGTTIQYGGDSGTKVAQVSGSQQISVNDSGEQVFMAVPAGNGTFGTAAASTNGGTGVIDNGSVTDSSLLTHDNYSLNFAVSGGATTYSVVDTTTGTTVSSGNPYTSGSAISVAGMQVQITGSPAAGDQFTLTSGGTQSLFNTFQNLINVLSTPVSTAADSAKLNNGINAALGGLNAGLNSVLATRASVGSRMNELTSLDTMGTALDTQYQQNLSQLQDLDYTKALSDFSQQQTALEAAQKSFTQVMGLSLFNYIQ